MRLSRFIKPVEPKTAGEIPNKDTLPENSKCSKCLKDTYNRACNDTYENLYKAIDIIYGENDPYIKAFKDLLEQLNDSTRTEKTDDKTDER